MLHHPFVLLPVKEPALTTAASRENPFFLTVALSAGGWAWGDLFWDDGDSLKTFETENYCYVNFTAGQVGTVFTRSIDTSSTFAPFFPLCPSTINCDMEEKLFMVFRFLNEVLSLLQPNKGLFKYCSVVGFFHLPINSPGCGEIKQTYSMRLPPSCFTTEMASS